MKTNKPGDSKALVQKLPSDMGIHRNPRKGTLDAPEKILEGLEFEQKVFIDEVFPDEFDLEETHSRIEENTIDLIDYDRPIVSVGGDHSVSFPVIKALKEKNPDMNLVWLDAHLDLKEKVGDNVSHDVVVRELLKNGFSEDEITFVGITEIDHDEKKFLEEHDLTVYTADEVGKFMEEYGSRDKTYLSVDIDVLNKEQAPGTGYRDGSLTPEQVLNIIELIGPNHGDLVEVAPSLDENNITVENSKKILKTLTDQV